MAECHLRECRRLAVVVRFPVIGQLRARGRKGTPVTHCRGTRCGVSIEVVRRRLGHASTKTTQVYTLFADKVADAEVRAARRRREMRRR
jgi:integrase